MHGIGWLEEGFPRPRGDEPFRNDLDEVRDAFSPPARG